MLLSKINWIVYSYVRTYDRPWSTICIHFAVLQVYCDEVQGPIVSVMGTNYTCTSGKEVG